MNLKEKSVARLQRLIWLFCLFVHQLAIRLHFHCQLVSGAGFISPDFDIAADMSGNINPPRTSPGGDLFLGLECLLFARRFIVLREADAHSRCGGAFDLDLEGVSAAPDLLRNTACRLRVRIAAVHGPPRQCDGHAEHGETCTNCQFFHFRIPRKNKRASDSVEGNSEAGIRVAMDCDVSIKPQRTDIVKKGGSESGKARRLLTSLSQAVVAVPRCTIFP